MKEDISWSTKVQEAILGAVPFAGPVSSLVLPLYTQLREIALVAALRGYDVNDEAIKSRILMCLVVQEGVSLPKAAVTRAASSMAAKLVARKIVNKAGASLATRAVASWLPIGVVYDLLVYEAPSMKARACEAFPALPDIDQLEYKKPKAVENKPGEIAASSSTPDCEFKVPDLRRFMPSSALAALLHLLVLFLTATALRLFLPRILVRVLLVFLYVGSRGYCVDLRLLAWFRGKIADYIKTQLLPEIVDEALAMQIHKDEGTFDVSPLGTFNYTIENAKLRKLEYDPLSSNVKVQFMPKGLWGVQITTVIIPKLDLEVTADWSYQGPLLHGGGSLVGNVSTRSLEIESFFYPDWEARKPRVEVQNVKLSLNQARIVFEGSSLSWVYNAFEAIFQNEILDLLQTEVGAVILEKAREEARDFPHVPPHTWSILVGVLSVLSLTWFI